MDNSKNLNLNIYEVSSLIDFIKKVKHPHGSVLKRMLFWLLFMTTLICVPGFTQNSTFYDRTSFLMASPSAWKYGLYGYDNPAILSTISIPDSMISWEDSSIFSNNINHYGFFIAFPHLGFASTKQNMNGKEMVDYQLSGSAGTRTFSIGSAFRWNQEDSFINLSFLFRPNPYLSIGFSDNINTVSQNWEITPDLSIRPFGNERLSLFADYSLLNNEAILDGKWSVGAVGEMLPGLCISGRYFNDNSFSLGLSMSFGISGVSMQSLVNKNMTYARTGYSIRLGEPDKTPLDMFVKKSTYVKIDLLGGLVYENTSFFKREHTLKEILEQIKHLKQDDKIGGIILNTSGMIIPSEMIWELREALKDFKSAGKHVVATVDYASLNEYYLASVADKIVLDPLGIIAPSGLAAAGLYFKGTLDKIGIGIDEFRLFKYKSAVESFSRTNMSDAQREQLRAILDSRYTYLKADIAESRKCDPSVVDGWINNSFIYTAETALSNRLIDSIGRTESVSNAIVQLEGKPMFVREISPLEGYEPSYTYWSEKPKIAIIYALGECAMDTGIRARTLKNVIKLAEMNPEIKAVVFRVDSPGGSALASDIVAEAIKSCKQKKPVVISMGTVAGSGGYWISIYGSKILAGPDTITGSIGVISYSLYDNGLKDKLGLTTDVIKIGQHADLAFSLLGFIQNRRYSDHEKKDIEAMMMEMYKGFVSRVSTGRGKSKEDIEKVAQGRVWSGQDALEKGLVDEIGGLDKSIQVAAQLAGIPNKAPMDVVELKNIPMGMKGLMNGVVEKTQAEKLEQKIVETLKFQVENNSKPLMILPLEYVPFDTTY